MGAIVFIKEGQFQVDAAAKVIKADEYLDYTAGKELIESAREKAQKIIESAKVVYEEEKKRGYEDGLMDGQMKITEQLMDVATSSLDYFESIESKMTAIVIQSTKKVIGALEDEDMIVRVVKNALAVARNQKQVSVRVAPQQVTNVENKLNEILAGFSATGFIDVIGDSRLGIDGCIVESDIGVVDASVDVQLAALEKSLLKSFKKTT